MLRNAWLCVRRHHTDSLTLSSVHIESCFQRCRHACCGRRRCSAMSQHDDVHLWHIASFKCYFPFRRQSPGRLADDRSAVAEIVAQCPSLIVCVSRTGISRYPFIQPLRRIRSAVTVFMRRILLKAQPLRRIRSAVCTCTMTSDVKYY